MTTPSILATFVKVNKYYYGPFTVETSVVLPTRRGKVCKRGPEDQTYYDHPELVKMVPRACSDLRLGDTVVARIRGLCKFDGTENGADEDDLPFEGATEEEIRKNKSFLPLDEIREWAANGCLRTTFQEKVNGKMLAFTLFEHEGSPWIFGGSKNMHVPHKLGDSIEGTNLHDEILRQICSVLKTTSVDVRPLYGKTICGEYVDGRHIVYVPEPYVVFFDPTLPKELPKPRELAEAVDGFPSPEALQAGRGIEGIEGEVINYTNTVTGQVHRQKHKTAWYIILRCWRELIVSKKNSDCSAELLSNLLIRKHRDRNNQFIHRPEEEMRRWDQLAREFASWLVESRYRFEDVGFSSPIGMAEIWHNFTNRLDTTPVVAEQKFVVSPCDYLIHPEYFQMVVNLAKVVPVDVIMQGVPGTGKSTIAVALQQEIGTDKCEIFCTDDFFVRNGEYVYDKSMVGRYHTQNFAKYKESTARVRICANTNTVPSEYLKYKTDSLQKRRVVVMLATKTADIATLVSRGVHSVPPDTLAKMLTKYSPASPCYLGYFVDETSMINSTGVEEKILTQTTPFHVTCQYIGGKNRPYSLSAYKSITEIRVLGTYSTDAGHGLHVDCGIGRSHITLGVLPGHKPAEMDAYRDEDVVALKKEIVLQGVLGLMF